MGRWMELIEYICLWIQIEGIQYVGIDWEEWSTHHSLGLKYFTMQNSKPYIASISFVRPSLEPPYPKSWFGLRY
jgi:hypothetical protein